MKQRLLLLTAVLVLTVTSQIQAQDAKLRLRDFTPKYRIDTFQVNGEPIVIKRKVIDAVEIKGIKSAFWEEDSRLLTIRYDSKLIALDKIKSVFAPQVVNAKEGSTPERKLPVAQVSFLMHDSPTNGNKRMYSSTLNSSSNCYSCYRKKQ